jgi:hypothetical protein
MRNLIDWYVLFRKSAGQTLFSTIAAHGSLLAKQTWQAVLWQVLFPLLDKVREIIQPETEFLNCNFSRGFWA